MPELLGRSPIPTPFFILGKLAFLFSFLFCIAKWANVFTMMYDGPFTQIAGIVLFVLGLFVVVAGLVQLGESKAFGPYRFTRNPMYLGGFIMGLGSCFYSIHLVNILFYAIAVSIHIAIITREEDFLAERFGQQWLEYKEHVPRLLGPIHRPGKSRNGV